MRALAARNSSRHMNVSATEREDIINNSRRARKAAERAAAARMEETDAGLQAGGEDNRMAWFEVRRTPVCAELGLLLIVPALAKHVRLCAPYPAATP